MTAQRPELWSDFDGTAVGTTRKIDPRNWTKYPLPALHGYVAFLRGVQSAGVDIGGVVSRRPDILVRRFVTTRSVSKLGLSEFFGDHRQLVHAGSEEAKGRFLIERSRRTTVGMLEDKPHKLGSVLLSALSAATQLPDSSRTLNPIIMGAVAHNRSQEYLERLLERVKTQPDLNLQVSEIADAGSHPTPTGFTLEAASVKLCVLALSPYTERSGERFGYLLDYVNQSTRS